MGLSCIFGHNMKPVAIDTRFGWQSTDRATKKTIDTADHILVYLACARCGERSIDYQDATADGRNFAISEHSLVAKARTIWLSGGPITTKISKKITWIDPSYAPLGGFENYLAAMKNDPILKEMIEDHQMVDDALGQLEVAIKLCQDNKPKDP